MHKQTDAIPGFHPASVICEEDLITFGSTTPAPHTTETETTTATASEPTAAGLGSTVTPRSNSTAAEGRVCTPVMVTAPPADGTQPEAHPVEPTNYISEYVRLRVGEFSWVFGVFFRPI